MAERTPGPYRWHEDRLVGAPSKFFSEGKWVLYGGADCAVGVTNADAEFIVRACNAHDALVEAARMIERCFPSVVDDDDLIVGSMSGAWLADLRAVLAAATEPSPWAGQMSLRFLPHRPRE